MRVSTRLTPALIVGLTLAAAPARADFALSLGLKWTPVSYTHPVSATGGGAMGPTTTPLEGWQTTSFDNSFGAFFLDGRLGVQLSLDLGYGSRHNDTTAGTAVTNTDLSYTQFGFALGGKFLITKPRKEHVSPFVSLNFFKYFASVSTSDKTVPNDQAGYVAGLVSPLGFDAAFGAEYFVTPGFSIAADVLGLRFLYSEGDYAVPGGFGGDSKVTTSNKYVTFYTAIAINYRFEIAAQVHVKDSSGEEPTATPAPTPKAKPKKAPERAPEAPPDNGEPPPEDPDSVD